MSYTTFNRNEFNFMDQPMFFGEGVNTARFDQQKHPKFEKLTDTQLAFFWRPQEINVQKDAAEFQDLPAHEQHIFISNLKYQTLLDSIQGRSPTTVLLPIVSDPALENWIETWAFSETIHTRSYTHILRGIFTEPSIILDDIPRNKFIMKRAESVTALYDELYMMNARKHCGLPVDKYAHARLLYLCMHSINALEAIRFYVSFACSFAFAERGIMIGNSKIIKLIARDEALHMSGTQYILREMQSGREGDLMARVAEDCAEEASDIFMTASVQEKEWASDYLFKDGSMVGLNKEILGLYIDHLTDQRMRAAGLDSVFEKPIKSPFPWINKYLNNDAVQETPQEGETGQYLTGQVDTSMDKEDFAFDL